MKPFQSNLLFTDLYFYVFINDSRYLLKEKKSKADWFYLFEYYHKKNNGKSESDNLFQKVMISYKF